MRDLAVIELKSHIYNQFSELFESSRKCKAVNRQQRSASSGRRWNGVLIEFETAARLQEAYGSAELYNTDLELRAIKIVSAARKLLVVDVFAYVHLTRVDLKDARTCLFSGMGKLNLAIQTS